ncbi:ATG26 [Symbiodinium necroappetens]|uniref:ATG26 protein n=1 Tax=Symbiodinium necroappetens TaxID=1628268 RepID=A0A812MME8_9DINO|nr:ATG26 [Symbiodinium necroappetens]
MGIPQQAEALTLQLLSLDTFVAQAKFIQGLSQRLLEIPNVDHTDGFSFFRKLQSFPQLGMWSESIMPRPLDFPVNFEVTGCVFIPRLEGWQPTAALSAFVAKKDASGLPPIAVTFGSVMGARRLAEVIIAAARQLGKSVIWCHDAKREGQAETTDFAFALPCDGQTTAEDVFEIEYVPFDWLLPRVSVTVCHGGAGTLWHSFRSRTPCVVCPMLSALFADQVTHADFVARAGLGTRVLELNPSIEACKAALLAAQSCSAACQRIGTKLQQEDGSVKAAAAIERISAEKETAQYPKTPRSNVCLPCF